MKKALSGIFVILLNFLYPLATFSQEAFPVTVQVESKKISETEYDIIFKTTIAEGWHQYSLKEVPDGPRPTYIEFKKSPDFELVGPVKESKPHETFDKMFEVTVFYFEKEAKFTQRIRLKTDKTVKVSGIFECQACTEEKCVFMNPPKKFSVEIKGKETAATAVDTSAATASLDTVKKDTAKTASVQTTPTTVTASSDNGGDLSCDTPWWLILLKGIGFGLAALITPCVFPMIPMNVSFFLKRNKKRSAAIKEAMLFMLSIVVIYTALGLLITAVFGVTALNAIASSATFNLLFFVILVVFGISFLGAFEIVLPSSWINKMDSQGDKGGFLGIFFMATTLSLVSFSCTSIFIGNLLTVVTDCPSGPLFGFLGFGFGFALPFGLFAIVPSWLQSMPKSGGWLNTVKVTLGLLELALALKFASNADLVYQAHILTREVFLTLWIVLFAVTGIYLMGWIKLSHDTPMDYLSIPRLFFAIFSFAFAVYMVPGLLGAPLNLLSGVIPPSTYAEWKPQHTTAVASTAGAGSLASKMVDGPQGIKVFHNDYESALAYAKEVKKPLLLDFTGHACANCRKMEDNVWPDPEVKSIMSNDVVIVSLFVDDREELPEAEQTEVDWRGDKVKLETQGMKWGYLQDTRYKISSQPYYVIIDHDESLLSNNGIGYDTGRDIPVYKKWLTDAIGKFRQNHP